MTTITDALANGAAEWFARALDLSIKGSVVLLAAAIAAAVARHRSAAARHALWSVAVAAVLALPLLQVVVPAWDVPLLPAVRMTIPITVRVAPETPAPLADVAAPHANVAPHAPLAAAPVVATHSAPAPEAIVTAPAAAPVLATPEPVISNAELELTGGDAIAAMLLSRNDWVAIIWLTGTLLVLLRIAAGTLGVWFISRRAAPVLEGDWLALIARLARRLGVSRPVTLLRSDRASVPVTWGVVYPVVLLPSETAGWGDERRAAVLLHELAHVRRFDALTQVIGQLALAVHWFNPLVWLAVRRMRAERERACDDAVLGAGTRASAYAEDLIDIVRSLHREPGPAFAALAMARRSELEGRLLAILDPRQPRGALGARSRVALGALALVLVAPIAAMRPVPVEARSTETSASALPVSAGEGTVGVAAEDVGALGTVGPVDGDGIAGAIAPGEVAAPIASAAGGPPPTSIYGAVAAAPSSMPSDAGRNGAPLPCRMRTLIGDDEPYSLERAEKMWFSGSDDRCVGATYRGHVLLSAARDDVRDLAPNGFLVIVEQRPSVLRRVEFLPERDGSVRKLYYENARRVTIDAEARRWMMDVLRELFARDGAMAVTAPPAPEPGLPSTSAQPSEPASGVMLSGTTAAYPVTPPPSAAPSAPSVFSALGPEESRETLILAARSAQYITTDGEKARLLVDVARRYTPNDSLRAVYLRAARTIVSDGSRRQALEALIRRDSLHSRAAVSVIGVARELVSEGDRSRVLLLVRQRSSLADSATRRAYFRAVGEIVSEGTRRALLIDALGAGAVSRDIAVPVLRAAGNMVSGRERGDLLLAVAARASLADAEVRRAFFAALEGMTSDADYRRVMAVVLQ